MIRGKKRHILGLLLHAIVHSAAIQDRDGVPASFGAKSPRPTGRIGGRANSANSARRLCGVRRRPRKPDTERGEAAGHECAAIDRGSSPRGSLGAARAAAKELLGGTKN